MKSYSQEFSSTESVEDYANRQYAAESFGSLMHDIEAEMLVDIVARHFATPPTHLDFACGTGRIAGALAPHTESTIGRDISPEMVKVAQSLHPSIDFQALDLLADAAGETQGDLDLITSFRFLLNAETDLAKTALDRLPNLLTSNGLLVVNIHSCLESYRVLPWTWQKVRKSLPDEGGPVGLFARRSDVEARFADAGLEIVEARSYGYLPDAVRRVVGNGRYRLSERLFSAVPGVRSLGTHRMYVLRPRTR